MPDASNDNMLNINNWIKQLNNSKQYIKANIININTPIKTWYNNCSKIDINMQLQMMNINNDPANIFIDKRLAKVNDWNIMLKDSSINKIYKKNCTLVKNKYNKYDIRDKP